MTTSEAVKSSGHLLVPESLRARFGRLRLYIRFTLRRARLPEYERLVRTLRMASRGASDFTVTPDDDREVAVSAHCLTRRSSADFHALVEFRSRSSAPYKVVPGEALRRYIAFVDGASQSLKLEHWQEWTAVRREALVDQLPEAARLLAGGKLQMGDRAAVLSGISIAVEPQGNKPSAGLSFDWTKGDRVVFSAWTEGISVESLRDAAVQGEALMGDLLVAASASQEHG